MLVTLVSDGVVGNDQTKRPLRGQETQHCLLAFPRLQSTSMRPPGQTRQLGQTARDDEAGREIRRQMAARICHCTYVAGTVNPVDDGRRLPVVPRHVKRSEHLTLVVPINFLGNGALTCCKQSASHREHSHSRSVATQVRKEGGAKG